MCFAKGKKYTALMYASRNGATDAAKAFIEMGADVNQKRTFFVCFHLVFRCLNGVSLCCDVRHSFGV